MGRLLESLRQRWKERHMIAAIEIIGKLSVEELKDIADYALALCELKLKDKG